MLRGVPARGGEIEPADEGHGVVDHDDLLVMAAAERMLGVEPEAHAAMAAPARAPGREQLALQREHQREVPVEDVDAQVAPRPAELVEELPEAAALGLGGGGEERRALLHVPADDEDALARPPRGGGEGGEVVGGVDQEGDPVGSLHAPGVASGSHDGVVCGARRVAGLRERLHGHAPVSRSHAIGNSAFPKGAALRGRGGV
ncbi:MAG: hypothetical protein KIT14_09790 [bacterium]|nr:hypothetical protein [bacterium]